MEEPTENAKILTRALRKISGASKIRVSDTVNPWHDKRVVRVSILFLDPQLDRWEAEFRYSPGSGDFRYDSRGAIIELSKHIVGGALRILEEVE